MKPTKPRPKSIELHYSEEEREIIERAAKIEGRSRKNFCEQAALKAAKSTLKTG